MNIFSGGFEIFVILVVVLALAGLAYFWVLEANLRWRSPLDETTQRLRWQLAVQFPKLHGGVAAAGQQPVALRREADMHDVAPPRMLHVVPHDLASGSVPNARTVVALLAGSSNPLAVR